MTKNEYQAKLLENRLKKRVKHLFKWAKKNEIFAFRVYDKDIPEIPLAIDVYKNTDNETFIAVFLYKRPYERSLEEEKIWAKSIIDAIALVFQISPDKIFLKTREKQKGFSQYTKIKDSKNQIVVREGEALFFVNLSDYLDTGLFLDHRPSRIKIYNEAQDKSVLNLYSYTGSFSIHALKGEAKSVCSVDLSNTYLNWTKKNLTLNNLEEKNAQFIRQCSIEFLKEASTKNKKWDIIICDPPTFSNSKQAAVFDINKDWKKLCLLCLSVLEDNGVLYFSSNSRKLKFDKNELSNSSNKKLFIKDISAKSIPEDFRNKNIHKMWEIKFYK